MGRSTFNVCDWKSLGGVTTTVPQRAQSLPSRCRSRGAACRPTASFRQPWQILGLASRFSRRAEPRL
jgi:hypothetical protein